MSNLMYKPVHGTQIEPLFDKTMWSAIHRIWQIPQQMHCNMLPLIAGVMGLEFWFAKRSIMFVSWN